MTVMERMAWAVLCRVYGVEGVKAVREALERARIADRYRACLDEARSTEPVTDDDRRRHAELVARQRERDEQGRG
jgi:hypothetical protein